MSHFLEYVLQRSSAKQVRFRNLDNSKKNEQVAGKMHT